jgi:hypothetical protein
MEGQQQMLMVAKKKALTYKELKMVLIIPTLPTGMIMLLLFPCLSIINNKQ